MFKQWWALKQHKKYTWRLVDPSIYYVQIWRVTKDMEHVIAFHNIKNVQMLQRHKGQWQYMFIQTLIMTHKRRWHKLSTQLWMPHQTRSLFFGWTDASKEPGRGGEWEMFLNWNCNMNATWTTITTGHELLWIFDSTTHT